jgi:hypothetical protein
MVRILENNLSKVPSLGMTSFLLFFTEFNDLIGNFSFLEKARKFSKLMVGVFLMTF